MRIKKRDKWKTAFRTRYGHLKYQLMSFGLLNALASFQEYINKILAEKLNVFIIVYLNDILIYTKNTGQAHVDADCQVLEKLKKHGLFADLKQCQFHKDEVCFLEYVVLAQRIRIKDERIEVVRNWPKPKSMRDIQVFLVSPISINFSSKALVRLLDHSPQCSKQA